MAPVTLSFDLLTLKTIGIFLDVTSMIPEGFRKIAASVRQISSRNH